MIWLASYPRSGNTFFRIVMHEAYGIESGAIHLLQGRCHESEIKKYAIVKTHFRPSLLCPVDKEIPAVYIVRDGRDALVSGAHYMKDFVFPWSDFEENLLNLIIAPFGTHFGRWGEHVLQWIPRASVIIRFEDLIDNPIRCTEKLREVMKMPKAFVEKLPTFDDLQSKKLMYNSRSAGKSKNTPATGQQFFRKGKVGSWRDEMPEDFHALFWKIHGNAMEKMGYTEGRPGISSLEKCTLAKYANYYARSILYTMKIRMRKRLIKSST